MVYMREGGREGGREVEREGGRREGGREGGRERGRKRETIQGREGEREHVPMYIYLPRVQVGKIPFLSPR